jgi:two-component system sensor histidine kinase ChvG
MSAARGKHEQLYIGSSIDGMPSYIAAAHELKSPLALMRQLSLMLEEGNLPIDEQKRMLRQISLTSERALRLTSDLTRSVRMSDSLFNLEPINPQLLCEDVVRELTPLFEANDREFKFVPCRSQLLLVANRDLLRRILINFGDNALHYADEYTSVELKVGSINAGKTIRLGVRDYGPALSSDILKSLKGKLIKSAAPIHARPQSSGLGLFIASQFASAMNGQIGITKHRNGATFYIDLQASKQLSLL